jgi:catechol 2,3-dioxygenase-like lactoylglutathione lyase family enzyme
MLMSLFQLSLNVSDVEAAVEFYTKLFGVGPAKQRPGYANFVVADPPLKFIVIENEGAPGTINHLGVEVADTEAVVAATHRLAELGLPLKVDDTHTCCYATQDKVWTSDPDSVAWETYTVLAATEEFGARAH